MLRIHDRRRPAGKEPISTREQIRRTGNLWDMGAAAGAAPPSGGSEMPVKMLAIKTFRNRDIAGIVTAGATYFAPTESLAEQHVKLGIGSRIEEPKAKGAAQKPAEKQAIAPAETQAVAPREVKGEPEPTPEPDRPVKRGPGRPRKHFRG